MICLANDLEPSMAAARRLGPKHRMPDACSASATPATSGASGPTTTRSAPVARARPATCPVSARSTGMLVGEPGDARVARRRMQVGDVRVGGQRPGQRVLAAARTEEKDSHGREPTRGHIRACGGTGRTAEGDCGNGCGRGYTPKL